jgi:hypothetical protein
MVELYEEKSNFYYVVYAGSSMIELVYVNTSYGSNTHFIFDLRLK